MTIDTDALKRTFGAIAGLYDEVRPDYPAEVIVAAIGRAAAEPPLRILEVGCGTGQATRLFAALGHQVHATDLSDDLVAVASQRLEAFPNVTFGIGPFEQLDLPDHAYDLVISAQAFHWIDPAAGLPKAARILAKDGALALFWNFVDYDATPELRGIRDLAVSHVPAFAGWPDASTGQFDAFGSAWEDAVREAGGFDAVERSVFAWTVAYTHERFQKLLATFSWTQTAPEQARAALFHAIEQKLAGIADPLALPMRTLLVSAIARVPGDSQYQEP